MDSSRCISCVNKSVLIFPHAMSLPIHPVMCTCAVHTKSCQSHDTKSQHDMQNRWSIKFVSSFECKLNISLRKIFIATHGLSLIDYSICVWINYWNGTPTFVSFFAKQGQTESKKRSSTVETKGTAISFGFKKKLLPSHKKNTERAKIKVKDAENNDRDDEGDRELIFDDKNGNCGESCVLLSMWLNSANHQNTFLVETDDAKTTPKSTPGSHRSVRFAMRESNAVRPASTGITSNKVTFHDSNANSNSINRSNGTFSAEQLTIRPNLFIASKTII